MPQEKKQITPAANLDKHHLTVDNDDFTATVFWARVVSSETESLLTHYTKHTFFEIQYALEGRLVITVGDNDRFTLEESDFIIIPPDTYHQIVDGDDTGARFILAFSLSAKGEATHEAVLRRGAIPHRESIVLRQLLIAILQKSAADTSHADGVLSGLIASFLYELCDVLAPAKREYAEEESANDTEGAGRVAAVSAYIRQYHGIGMTVSTLARHFGISERHLGRLFRTEAQTTVREAINHEKLRYMEELIASTPLSLMEISALCGFCDEYAMNKFFKRYNRMRLSDYRRTAQHRTK